jgi:hypothetical protein
MNVSPSLDRPPLVTVTPDGLYCPSGRFHIDPWRPVERALITHAHGDHARGGSQRYLAAALPRPAAQAARRGREPHPCSTTASASRWGEVTSASTPRATCSGSAQIRIEHRARSGWCPATTSAIRTRRAPPSSPSAATPSSPRPPSGCPSTAGTTRASSPRRCCAGGTATARREKPRCSSATRWARRSACWVTGPTHGPRGAGARRHARARGVLPRGRRAHAPHPPRVRAGEGHLLRRGPHPRSAERRWLHVDAPLWRARDGLRLGVDAGARQPAPPGL